MEMDSTIGGAWTHSPTGTERIRDCRARCVDMLSERRHEGGLLARHHWRCRGPAERGAGGIGCWPSIYIEYSCAGDHDHDQSGLSWHHEKLDQVCGRLGANGSGTCGRVLNGDPWQVHTITIRPSLIQSQCRSTVPPSMPCRRAWADCDGEGEGEGEGEEAACRSVGPRSLQRQAPGEVRRARSGVGLSETNGGQSAAAQSVPRCNRDRDRD